MNIARQFIVNRFIEMCNSVGMKDNVHIFNNDNNILFNQNELRKMIVYKRPTKTILY